MKNRIFPLFCTAIFVLCGCFLASCHEHALQWTVKKEATCEQTGIEIQKCDGCDETGESREIPATGHREGDWNVTTEATCEKPGEKSLLCANCGAVLKTETLAVTDHEYGDWTSVVDATCTESGREVRACRFCRNTETRPVEAIGHVFDGWFLKKEATCAEEGERERKCKNCDLTETETVPKTAHTYGDWVVSESTCTQNGSESRTCSACGAVETQTVPAPGHVFTNWTVTTEATYEAEGSRTRTCTGCGMTETETIPMLELTKEEKRQLALQVAQKIAASITATSDLEKVEQAAYLVSQYSRNCRYTMEGEDYSQAYGVFVKGEYSCAGSTRALGMVLDCLGIRWEHVNENEYTHQWCRVWINGEEGFADGQAGIAGFGKHPAEID